MPLSDLASLSGRKLAALVFAFFVVSASCTISFYCFIAYLIKYIIS